MAYQLREDSESRTVRKIFKYGFADVPEKYKSELIEERTILNISRQNILSTVLIIIMIASIFFDFCVSHSRWEDTPAYKYLFYGHAVILFWTILYCGAFYLVKRRNDFEIAKTGRIFNIGFILYTLTWCATASITDQFIQQQMTTYVIGIFCIASTFILEPKESFLIYISTYLVFFTGMNYFCRNPEQLEGHITNSAILMGLAFIISRILYSSYVNDFIYRKIILEKNKELELSKESLEDTVKSRTRELIEANEKIIEAINSRHEMELRIMASELAFEEKTRQLNEIREYEKIRRDFFANISHELRTPLNVILCSHQMIELVMKNNALLEDERIARYMSTMKQNCFRLVKLINNIIDITKIDSGYFQVELGNYDIVEVVEDITLSVAEYIKGNKIEFIFDTEIEEKIIACDPEKIERIILNLLSNAVKFTPEGGSISVNIFDRGSNIEISVKDTGIGIPEDKQQVIFERFVQVDKSLSRKAEGSGIGLSLVKSLVEMHGGTILVRSEYGKGSEFIICLPNRLVDREMDLKNDEVQRIENNTEKIIIEFSDISA